MKPRVLSLFAGIGGFDLGLERAGMEVVGQCEIDPFCRQVLRKHWPDCWQWDDVRTLTGDVVREHCGQVDVICGGYPCQPFAQCGKRLGTDDERHLWPECLRLLCDLRPKFALFENVRGHLSLGLDAVLSDLAGIGFDAEWTLLSASALGAPHQRLRLFLVAYPKRIGHDSFPHEMGIGSPSELSGAWRQTRATLGYDCPRIGGQSYGMPVDWRMADGVSPDLEDAARRVKALGNAIVPQCAEWVGRCVIRALADSAQVEGAGSR